MPEPDHRLTELEIALAHAERTIEELSEVVRGQDDRVALIERQLAALASRLRAIEDRAPPPPADQPPPHW